jgi:lipoprotein-releasing system ATP-binding protein
MSPHPTADFRPEKPRLDLPGPAPRANVRLVGMLKGPDGRSLLNPPTLELNELFEQPSLPPTKEMIPFPTKESITFSAKTAVSVQESLRLPFLFDSLPAIEPLKKGFEVKSFYREDDLFERFNSIINRVERQQTISLPGIPPLPEWDRSFEEKPVTELPVQKTELESKEQQLNTQFEEIDVFLARKKPAETPVIENTSTIKNIPVLENVTIVENIPAAENVSVQEPIAVSAVSSIISPAVRRSREAVFRKKRHVAVSVIKTEKTPEITVPFKRAADELLCTENLTKSYYKKKLKIPVLKGVNLSVQTGEFVSIVGQSGSGKSTLLHLLGTLDNPESGTIHFEGQRIDHLPIVKRDALRNRSIGFIFQFYHLLPELTTLENVLSPLMIRDGILGYFFRRHQHIEKAKAILEKVGLSHRLKHKPSELSGGEMQRAAIARALISEPKILLADEPTGNLDAASASEIIHLLRGLKAERKLTIIMVTHDNQIAEAADRIVRMVDGVIV